MLSGILEHIMNIVKGRSLLPAGGDRGSHPGLGSGVPASGQAKALRNRGADA